MTDFFIPKKSTQDHWYKEPWMLLVLGGPLIVVIAGFVTLYLAAHGADKVLSKDYYKQGINIDKDIRRDANAAEYKLQANIELDPVHGKILLALAGKTLLPDTVMLTIATDTGSSEYENTQQITLSQVKPGQYEGPIKATVVQGKTSDGLWHIKIETADWRLTGDWQNHLHRSLQIKTQN